MKSQWSNCLPLYLPPFPPSLLRPSPLLHGTLLSVRSHLASQYHSLYTWAKTNQNTQDITQNIRQDRKGQDKTGQSSHTTGHDRTRQWSQKIGQDKTVIPQDRTVIQLDRTGHDRTGQDYHPTRNNTTGQYSDSTGQDSDSTGQDSDSTGQDSTIQDNPGQPWRPTCSLPGSQQWCWSWRRRRPRRPQQPAGCSSPWSRPRRGTSYSAPCRETHDRGGTS